VQYTRNMVTGTSTAQLAIVLVDAGTVCSSSPAGTPSGLPARCAAHRAGGEQMDLVDWDEKRFNRISDEFHEFAARLDVHD
jgi:bifunctional enzyme CysN/CysC